MAVDVEKVKIGLNRKPGRFSFFMIKGTGFDVDDKVLIESQAVAAHVWKGRIFEQVGNTKWWIARVRYVGPDHVVSGANGAKKDYDVETVTVTVTSGASSGTNPPQPPVNPDVFTEDP